MSKLSSLDLQLNLLLSVRCRGNLTVLNLSPMTLRCMGKWMYQVRSVFLTLALYYASGSFTSRPLKPENVSAQWEKRKISPAVENPNLIFHPVY